MASLIVGRGELSNKYASYLKAILMGPIDEHPKEATVIDKIHVTRTYTFHPMKRVSVGTNNFHNHHQQILLKSRLANG